MKVIKAPENIHDHVDEATIVFLAGSIAMGEVEDWQAEASAKLSDYTDEQLVVLNPRRDDFEPNAKQSIDDPYLNQQINWELDGLDEAYYVLMYFHPDTLAPITLLELGLQADNICKVVACCPDGFYRQANVEIVCNRFKIPFYKDLNEAVKEIRSYIDYDHKLGQFSDDEQ